MLSHQRFVPKNISNKITLQDNIETYENTTKIDLLDFLEILKWARWGKENWTVAFILVHSITELYPVYQDNLSLVSTVTTKNLVKYGSYLWYKIALMTAVFFAATRYNTAVLFEVPQHPPFNALHK